MPKPRITYGEFVAAQRGHLTPQQKAAPITGEVLGRVLEGVGKDFARTRLRVDNFARFLPDIERRLVTLERRVGLQDLPELLGPNEVPK